MLLQRIVSAGPLNVVMVVDTRRRKNKKSQQLLEKRWSSPLQAGIPDQGWELEENPWLKREGAH